jgi:hypothetical protein
MKTTLAEIRRYKPCNQGPDDPDTYGWNCLMKNIGPDWPENKPIPLTRILESNGIEDTLWTLRIFGEAGKRIAVKFALACAHKVSPVLKDKLSYPDSVVEAAEVVAEAAVFSANTDVIRAINAAAESAEYINRAISRNTYVTDFERWWCRQKLREFVS